MSGLALILKAFLPSLIKHGVEMYKDKQVLKDNLKKPSTAVAGGAIAVAGALEAVQQLDITTLPVDPTAAQFVLAAITVVCFLFRKYQDSQ